MDDRIQLKPDFSAPGRYAGEWVIPARLGRAHRVVSRSESVAVTACGRTCVGPLPAEGSWDGCLTCVRLSGDPRT